MDRVSMTDPIWTISRDHKGPISVTRLTGEVVWIDASTTNEPDDATLGLEDEQRIAEVTLAGRSDLRNELETVFGGPAWPQASAIVESFRRYAMKVFDVNAMTYRKSVSAQGKNSNEALNAMVRNLLRDVFGSEWESSPGDRVVRTDWQYGAEGWKGIEVTAIAGNDPDPNCLYHQLIADAIQYRYRFHAAPPAPIPGEPPGINLSNLEWWQYIGLNERHNVAMAIKPYLEDRMAHWQFVYATPSAKKEAEMAAQITTTETAPDFDVFVSHASEDKNYVEPLVSALRSAGIRVWFDKTILEWGDDLRSAIDRGLTNCRYGIVVFSKAFLSKKKWTEYELNTLFAREEAGKKLILPIWHDVSRDDLIRYSPAFADRLAKISATDSYADIVESLHVMLGRATVLRESTAAPDSTPVQMKPAGLKPNAVAFARYETTGKGAVTAEAYVRPSAEKAGWFTFENSLGEEQHGTMEEIAMRFVMFDKSLTLKGYIRKQYGNSGDRAFSL